MYPDEKPPVYSEKPPADERAPATAGDSEYKPELSGPTTTTITTTTFAPTHSLTINARGVSWLRLPLPPRELITEVLRGPHNPAYTSTRHARCSGDCTLTAHPSGATVAQTSYFFGPGRSRSPLITFGSAPDSETASTTRVESSGGFVGRNASFVYGGQRWEWRYESDYRRRAGSGCRRNRNHGMNTNLLVLYRGAEKVAELVRNDETRTEGTGKSYAGNGGELMLGGGVDEAVAVATVCVMLKREIDRRRVVQMMIMGAAAGGP